MTHTNDRAQLAGEFAELARRIEKLRYLEAGDHDAHLYDMEKVQLWQALYGDNATNVLGNRAVLKDKPNTVSAKQLGEWIAYARETLTRTPPDQHLYG